MIMAYFFYENTSWDVYETILPSFKFIYSTVLQIVLSSPERSVLSGDGNVEGLKHFAGYLCLFSNKNATQVKRTTLVGYSINLMVMNSSAKYRCWLGGHGHTMLEFIFIRVGNDMKDNWSFHELEMSVYWFKCPSEGHF